MDIVLIAGLWLKSSIWTDVSAALVEHGHRPIPVPLPGVDDSLKGVTLADQVAAVVAAVDAADRPMVVGHSAASTLAWLAADQRPEAIEAVVLIGGFPASDGESYADFFEATDGVVAFPGWDPFEGPDSADLDEANRQDFAANAVPVLEGVAKAIVRLSDDQRFNVRVLAVCPEYSIDEAQAWIEAGDVPELAKVKRLTFIDIESGHWPMVSKPTELARILAEATQGG